MYPDSFYNTGGAQYPPMAPPAPNDFAGDPMWMQMPPGFSPMPFPGQPNCPGGDCGGGQQQGGAPNNQNFGFPPMQGYPFPGFGPPSPPNFSGYYPM